MQRARLALIALVCTGLSVAGQAPALQFEAASVKPSPPSSASFGLVQFGSTQVVGRNVTVDVLLLQAYGLRTEELLGAPDWVYQDKFDIVATARPGASRQDKQAMLRHLVEERFALRLHREVREMPVYVLSRLRTNGDLGPGLGPSTCPSGETCQGQSTTGMVRYRGAPWSAIVDRIAGALDRRLVDRTGLSGAFDVELTYGLALSTSGDEPGDIFTAVQQQLGLKLERGSAPIDVTVIDRVSRPTPD